MKHSNNEPKPSPSQCSAFPLQPDPGLPASAFTRSTVPQPTANGVTKPPCTSSSDISATAAAVYSLALGNNNEPPPSTNPRVTRAGRIVLSRPLGNHVSNGDSETVPGPASADTVPLLVKDLDGSTRQVNVPPNMNVDDIQKMLLEESGVPNPNAYKLSFGDTDIEPGVALSKTNVIPAYTHASNLLQVIGSSRLQPQKTAQAVESVCGVVRSLSNGVTDIDTLCAAATSSLEDTVPPLASTALGEQVGDAPTGLNDLFPSDSARDNAFAAAEGSSMAWGDGPSPAALVRNLSRLMPDHFVHNASEEFANNSFMADYNMGISGFEDPVSIPGFGDNMASAEQTARETQVTTQPHITDIARIRRARQAMAGSVNDTVDDALVDTGLISNLAVTQLDIATSMAAAAASGYGNGQAVVASNGDGTWMGDVKTSWEAGIVRNSGVLDRTPTGKDLDAKFKALDVEMEDQHIEIGRSDSSDHESSATSSVTTSAASAPAAPSAPSAMDIEQQSESSNPSIATTQPSSVPTPPSATSTQSAPSLQTQPVVPTASLPASAPVTTSNSASTGNTSAPSGQPTIQRKATLIAPSPPPHLSPFDQQPLSVTPKPTPALRRGRRPKNPHHTPEERMQRRKEQKRQSARQARIRKKCLEDDYQHKVRTLLGENEQLKMQVADLSHRLECLQGLLTVSLKPVNRRGNPAPLYPVRPTTVPPQAAMPQFTLQRPIPGQGGNFQLPFGVGQQGAFPQRQPQQNGPQQQSTALPQQQNTQHSNSQPSVRPFAQAQQPSSTGQTLFR